MGYIRPLTSLLLLMAALRPASANNLAITNVALSAAGPGLADVVFDTAWENSWRDSTNFDACWHFVKYSTDGGVHWRHATLAAGGTNPAGFSAGSMAGLELVVPADRKGAFLQRTGEGDGAITSTNVRLVWDFAADGVSSNASAAVKVMGLEMVYIPAGPFYVGGDTNGTGNNQWTLYPTEINTADMSQTNITGGGTLADPFLAAPSNSRPGRVWGTFSPTYPNGYNAFYLMKYEMTEGQYVEFLNTLTVEQALSRYPDLANWSRHTITGTVTAAGPAFTTAAPHRAASFYYFLDCWVDAAALVDWAALRPSTEMEYEKACRGPGFPVHREFPWGLMTEPAVAFTNVADDGTAWEGPNTNAPDANVNLTPSVPDGPIRVGAFATAASGRVKSGASYYGVLDLAGNVIERVVSSGPSGNTPALAQFPSYSGQHGDGELSPGGMPDTPGWPTNGDHYGGRGGGWSGLATDAEVRLRRSIAYMYQLGYGGVRAARTAP